MKKFLMFLVVTASSNVGFSQHFNFGFENASNPQRLPDGWYGIYNGLFRNEIDSINKRSGKNALLIESSDEYSTYILQYDIPAQYRGKQITLSTYVKTSSNNQNINLSLTELDNNYRQIDFTTPSHHETTTDWKQYHNTISMSGKAKIFRIRIDFQGQGKFWIDDVEIQIDGKDISTAKKKIRRISLAEKDTEFVNGSDIIFPELNNKLIAELELLGKLWGFLKYYHPQVGTGKYNWDYELFRILPSFLQAECIEQRDRVLIEWIEKYGKIKKCRKCIETHNDAYLKPDLSWIKEDSISDELRNFIMNIYSNRHQGKHYYVGQTFSGSPIFLNENPYTNMAFYPDAGYRLLALFRYWNMIQYFFPYKYVTDKNWNDVLKEHIPKFITAKNEFEYELAAIQLIGEVNDTHANIQNKIYWSRGIFHPPFDVRFVEQKWVVTDYYNPELKEISGIEIGDIITHIGGKQIESIVDSVRIYYPASNEATRLRDISYDLLRNNKNSIDVGYISSGQSKQKELTIFPRNNLNILGNRNEKSYKFVNDSIGYITLASIKYDDIPAIKEAFKNTKGIIIDIRNYPAADVRQGLGSWFVSQSAPFAKHTRVNINNPGEFFFHPDGISNLRKSANDESYQGKLVVIVNETTQSHAEHTAMAFRTGDNTTIVGSHTAGANGNVSHIKLPGGLNTMISGIGVYFPDGTQTQRIGIIPDIWVEPTIDGIKEGRDELLERAIKIIFVAK